MQFFFTQKSPRSGTTKLGFGGKFKGIFCRGFFAATQTVGIFIMLLITRLRTEEISICLHFYFVFMSRRTSPLAGFLNAKISQVKGSNKVRDG